MINVIICIMLPNGNAPAAFAAGVIFYTFEKAFGLLIPSSETERLLIGKTESFVRRLCHESVCRFRRVQMVAAVVALRERRGVCLRTQRLIEIGYAV